MAKIQRSYRFSDWTLRQISELSDVYGADATEVIEKAVDRMYQETIKDLHASQPVEARQEE